MSNFSFLFVPRNIWKFHIKFAPDVNMTVVVFCFSSQFSCVATVPTRPPPADGGGLVHWAPEGPGSHPGLSHLPTPRQRSGPALLLKLFVTENYEQGRTGPCFITANQRVYVEVCVYLMFSKFSF